MVAPEPIGRRRRIEADENPAASYVTRLFGIRTMLIGYGLLQRDPAVRERALRVAPIIHLSDTAVAIAAGAAGKIPRKAAMTTAAISTTNTVLALTARRSARSG